MSERYKKTCKYLNYAQPFHIAVSTVSYRVSVFALASLVCVSVGITSSSVGIKIFAIPAVIEKYRLIIKKKKVKYDKIVLLEKDRLNTNKF